eukprot:3053401-Rhodomonas_salina.1
MHPLYSLPIPTLLLAHSYLRNYIGSSHQPHMGPDGVEIFVKLFQMSLTHAEPETTAVNAAPGAPG